MRWRVGRKPTSRNMAFTSCQGQPLRPDRSGDRSALVFVFDIMKARVGAISFKPKRPAPHVGSAKSVSVATYTHRLLRRNRFATTARLALSLILQQKCRQTRGSAIFAR